MYQMIRTQSFAYLSSVACIVWVLVMAWGFAREENIPFLLIHLIFAPFEFHTIASWRLEKLIVFKIFGGRSLPVCLVFGFLTMSLQRCFVTLLRCSYTITLMESSRSVTEIPVVNLQCISIFHSFPDNHL